MLQWIYILEVANTKNDSRVVDTMTLSGGVVAESKLIPQSVCLGRWVKSRELSLVYLRGDERWANQIMIWLTWQPLIFNRRLFLYPIQVKKREFMSVAQLENAHIITALVTPFKADGEINFAALPKLIEHCLPIIHKA